MKHTLLLLSVLGFSIPAFADDHAGGSHAGDPEAGKAKSAVCAACHGADGNSMNPEWPKIAGQHASYLVGQLQAYKSGARKNALMNGQAMGLSEEDMKDLAAYFTEQEMSAGVADPELVAIAEPIWRGGKADTGTPACSGCHGPAGMGNSAAQWPRLAGQHAAYSATQLKLYREGTRAGTANAQMMSQVAKGLTDKEIEALASYMSGLHQ